MISISKLPSTRPYDVFVKYYKKAIKFEQTNIEAISISSFNKLINEVESRIVNLKYINNNNWVFFTNLESPKSKSFETHDQIAALFFWETINVQIRIKAKVKIYEKSFSEEHFATRDRRKNALAISSNQSQRVKSYSEVIKDYNKVLQKNDTLKSKPEYWGGYSFTPYYFEFWEGHDSRINKREVFELVNNVWENYFIQP